MDTPSLFSARMCDIGSVLQLHDSYVFQGKENQNCVLISCTDRDSFFADATLGTMKYQQRHKPWDNRTRKYLANPFLLLTLLSCIAKSDQPSRLQNIPVQNAGRVHQAYLSNGVGRGLSCNDNFYRGGGQKRGNPVRKRGLQRGAEGGGTPSRQPKAARENHHWYPGQKPAEQGILNLPKIKRLADRLS